MEAWRLADLHAYVDDCLGAEERLAFERKMADDPALASRAATWRAQNRAICSAFDGEAPRAFSINIARHQSEIPGKGRQPASAAVPGREQLFRSSSASLEDPSRIVADLGAAGALRTLSSSRLVLGAMFVCLFCVWAPPAPVYPARGLGEAAAAAFLAFVRSGVVPAEFPTGDSAEAQQWLSIRLLRAVNLPAPPATISLIGARVAPYPGGPAAFVIYDAQGKRVALLVRPLDAPPARAPRLLVADGRDAAVWTWRGQGLALVGDLDAASLLKIADDLFEPRPEAAQTIPERGS